MFICNHCGELFDEALTSYETHTEVDFNRKEERSVCPNCGEEDFEKAFKCQECGKVIPENQSKYNMCESCERETLRKIAESLGGFSENQIDLCVDFWEQVLSLMQIQRKGVV